jgi:hypothetical protein
MARIVTFLILDCGACNVHSSPFNQTTNSASTSFSLFTDNAANLQGGGGSLRPRNSIQLQRVK